MLFALIKSSLFFLIVSLAFCEDKNDMQEIELELSFGIKEEKQVNSLDIVLTVIYGAIILIGLLANGIVFFVIFARGEINRTVTALYVLQLAIADTIFLVSLPIFTGQLISKEFSFEEGICKISKTIQFLNYYASIFFLTAMSVDRYVAVAYSTKSHTLRSKKRTVFACFIVWFSSLLLTLPVAIYATNEPVGGSNFCRIVFDQPQQLQNSNESYYDLYLSGYEDDKTDADFENKNLTASGTIIEANSNDDYVDNNEFISNTPAMLKCSSSQQSNLYVSWIYINFFLGFLLPLAIIGISYLLILKHVYESEEKLSSLKGRQSSAMRKRVTRMVAVLVLCFAACWLPHQTLLLLKKDGSLITSFDTCNYLEKFFVALGFSNSALNPVLYTFLGQNFKERFSDSIRRTKSSMFENRFKSLKLSTRSNNGVGFKKSSKKSCESGFRYQAGNSDHANAASIVSERRRDVIRQPQSKDKSSTGNVITQTNMTELTRITSSSVSSDKP